jgi:hypothetical protein
MELIGEVSQYQHRLLLGTIISLMGADGIISNFLMKNNLATELNPFIKNLVLDNNFPLSKVTAALICVFILWFAIKRKPKLIFFATSIIVLSYTLIVYWNLLVFFLVTYYVG